jgi:hypothetical protein
LIDRLLTAENRASGSEELQAVCSFLLSCS